MCANRVVEKFTGLVSKNLGWGGTDPTEAELRSNSVTPLATVLQAVDTHLQSITDSYEMTAAAGANGASEGENDAAWRERWARVIGRLSGLAALGSELSLLLEQHETVVDALRTTRSALDRTTDNLSAETDAHSTLKNSFAAIDRELVLQRSETAVLQAQLEHMAATHADLQEQIQRFESDLHDARAMVAQSVAETEGYQTRIAALAHELQTSQQDLTSAEIAAVALRTELSAALSHASDVDAANSALQVALSDSRDGAQQLGESLDETYQELQRTLARIAELEQQAEERVGANAQATAVMESEAENRRAATATLHIQVAVLTARLEAADRLISDVPALIERAAAWEQKVAELEAENAEFRAQATEFEQTQQALAERTHALLDAFKAKDRETSQTKASLVAITVRLENETKRFDAVRAHQEGVIAELRQQLESKRVAQGDQWASEQAQAANGELALAQRLENETARFDADRAEQEGVIAELRQQLQVERSRHSDQWASSDALTVDAVTLEVATKQLEEDRARQEAVIADLRTQLDQARSVQLEAADGSTTMPQTARTRPDAHPEINSSGPNSDGAVESDNRGVANSASQRTITEDSPKPNPAGGRKRGARNRESNRHISRSL